MGRKSPWPSCQLRREQGIDATITLNSEEAKAELTLLEAKQEIQEVFSGRIKAQSSEEYRRFAEKISPKGLMNAETQRKVDSQLVKQPYSMTAREAIGLVIIAHECYAKVFDEPGDEYISVWPEISSELWGSTEPVPVLHGESHGAIEDYRKAYLTLGRIRTAAAKNPALMRLLDEIEPAVTWPAP
jgi:hypothetical protein